MRVLIACEYSGRVRDAFRALGHDAMSVDLLPTDAPGPHHQGDVFDVLGDGWDLMVAHPPCTYMANSGSGRLYILNPEDPTGPKIRNERRWAQMEEGARFFKSLWEADVTYGIPRIAVENPIMLGAAKEIIGATQSQSIQPYEFGADASKRTMLWLKGLPKLKSDPANYVPPRITEGGQKRWANQTDSGQNRLAPSEDRWKLRSATYPGIASAMAKQWSAFIENEKKEANRG